MRKKRTPGTDPVLLGAFSSSKFFIYLSMRGGGRKSVFTVFEKSSAAAENFSGSSMALMGTCPGGLGLGLKKGKHD